MTRGDLAVFSRAQPQSLIKPRRGRGRLFHRVLLPGIWQHCLWSMGNALTAGTLLLYLAMDRGAKGLTLSWILAAPQLVGFLRMGAPWFVNLFRSERRACLALYAAAYLVQLGQLPATLPGNHPWRHSLAALVCIVCLHQLLEAMGHAILYAWMGQLVPNRIRGRYFAWRNTAGILVSIPTLLLAGRFVDACKRAHPDWPLFGYTVTMALGCGLFLLGTACLAWLPLPRGAAGNSAPLKRQTPELATDFTTLRITPPWRDGRFFCLLAYGCMAALATGITQAAQNLHAKQTLHCSAEFSAGLRTLLSVGQMLVGPAFGHWVDLRGSRQVMLCCQAITAIALLGLPLASTANRWPLVATYLGWAAFAGLNVAIPQMCLLCGDARSRAAALATYFGCSGVIYGLATVTGGALYDLVRPIDSAIATAPAHGIPTTTTSGVWLLFLAGVTLRLLALVPLTFLPSAPRGGSSAAATPEAARA